MKEIELTSINFETLKKFEDIETQESVVYHDDKKVYKLYKNFNMLCINFDIFINSYCINIIFLFYCILII